MIAELTGKIVKKTFNHVVLDVGGVGYLVSIPLSTFTALPDDDRIVRLYVHTHVREDTLSLFGFLTEEERQIFVDLISVSGIGPKLATTILSGGSAGEVRSYIVAGNITGFTGFPGVGKKTAERIVLELKEKLAKRGPVGADVPDGTPGGPADVVEALVNLGYARPQAHDAVREAAKNGATDLGEILKGALKALSKW
jgi:holliday junction DNA helicase RuvA